MEKLFGRFLFLVLLIAFLGGVLIIGDGFANPEIRALLALFGI